MVASISSSTQVSFDLMLILPTSSYVTNLRRGGGTGLVVLVEWIRDVIWGGGRNVLKGELEVQLSDKEAKIDISTESGGSGNRNLRQMKSITTFPDAQ